MGRKIKVFFCPVVTCLLEGFNCKYFQELFSGAVFDLASKWEVLCLATLSFLTHLMRYITAKELQFSGILYKHPYFNILFIQPLIVY
jgi:hypothetical protein